MMNPLLRALLSGTACAAIPVFAADSSLSQSNDPQPAPVAVAVQPPAPPASAVPAAEKPVVQLALLLDTSGSMDGLINQARSQLWKIINTFATAKRDGKAPDVQVALYEYGNDGLKPDAGWIRCVVSFSNDLDKVSEELFKLRTNGGSEHCGEVIQTAVRNLQWSTSPGAYKAIFIAGNEPFTQGPVDFSAACKAAVTQGVVVNTIHCGDEATGVQGRWKDAAALADGSFLNINQNEVAAHIPAPQDAEIAKLGVELNKTYIAFGAEGAESLRRQSLQDSNADAALAGANVQRALCKATANYINPSWDLVDAVKSAPKKLEELKESELPEELRKLNLAERKAFLEKRLAERTELQKKITALNAERETYVADIRKKKSETQVSTLDTAIIEIVKRQAGQKRLVFE